MGQDSGRDDLSVSGGSGRNLLEKEPICRRTYTAIQRIGMLGEKLQTKEELAEHGQTGCITAHFMSELPEYQEIDEKYKTAEKELEEYREQCRIKAMELFTKWMPHLWD